MVHRVPFQVRKKSRKWPYLGPWALNQKNKTTLFPSILKSLFCKNQLGVQFLPSYMKPQKRNESAKMCEKPFLHLLSQVYPICMREPKKVDRKNDRFYVRMKKCRRIFVFFSSSSIFIIFSFVYTDGMKQG